MSNDHSNGHPPHSPYGHPPHSAYGHQPQTPYAPAPPLAMPGQVRAAQVVVFVMGGLAVLATVLAGAVFGAEDAGRTFAMYLMTVPLFVLAFRYPTGGNGVRVASIVLACVQGLLALSATSRGAGGGLVPLAGVITLVVLLAPATARDWFRRPRGGTPPQVPYGPYGT